MKKKIIFFFGTRPEAIKLAPLIHLFKKDTANFETIMCVSGQHKEMLQQVMDFFELTADHNLALMEANQTLTSLTERGIGLFGKLLANVRPDYVVVQGDTTTAFIGALVAYYHKVKVVHVEAGLRSFDKYAPFPEEANRKMVGVLSDFHFAPTKEAFMNLQKESIVNGVHCVGNTVIDALLWTVKKVEGDTTYHNAFSFLDMTKKIILVTCHRRENFGSPLQDICSALIEIATTYPETQIVYPVHLNPNIKDMVEKELLGYQNIFLIPPLSYPMLVWLMSKSYFVLTDSGGIQEEAPSLGKPVLVMREVTERMEGVIAGTAILVGTSKEKIVMEAKRLQEDAAHYNQMAKANNPYGDGFASQKIFDKLKAHI
jgi:UDP-N-acetylglucosamine 2-epimerase (non-hydrolysing)